MQPQYHFTKHKLINQADGTVTYVLKVKCDQKADPGSDLSIDLFEEYVRQLKIMRVDRFKKAIK